MRNAIANHSDQRARARRRRSHQTENHQTKTTNEVGTKERAVGGRRSEKHLAERRQQTDEKARRGESPNTTLPIFKINTAVPASAIAWMRPNPA